jgi:hypothetical protein
LADVVNTVSLESDTSYALENRVAKVSLELNMVDGKPIADICVDTPVDHWCISGELKKEE